MANINVLNSLYNKRKSPLEFNFDMLSAPPILSLLTPMDIFELNKIARSVKLAGKIDEKYMMIDYIMNNRGFERLHAGTNRIVYRFIENQRFVIKVAVDRVGLSDNPAEFKNQFLLKPFITKVFEVSPCGTVGLFERVDAVMSREEFMSIADDVFDLITKFFVGKYILEDFGSHYFMNWGVRKGFSPVLLDFPYVYELDGNKLFCNASVIPGRKDIVCGGQLDYDEGFNNLICTKCGREYQARDLKKAEKNNLIIVGGKKTMRVQVKIGSDVILDSGKNKVSKVIEQPSDVRETIVLNDNSANEEKKTETISTKVQSRSSDIVETKNVINKPSDAIFDKKSDSQKDDNIFDNIDTMIKEEKEAEDNDQNYDDEENYENYLSNRERGRMRKERKHQNKKNNNDYSEF